MGKGLIIFICLSCFTPTDMPAEPVATSTSNSFRKPKEPKVYRKKRGFLWGLFKSKKSCDCPKY
jgi:hypothetical protein